MRRLLRGRSSGLGVSPRVTLSASCLVGRAGRNPTGSLNKSKHMHFDLFLCIFKTGWNVEFQHENTGGEKRLLFEGAGITSYLEPWSAIVSVHWDWFQKQDYKLNFCWCDRICCKCDALGHFHTGKKHYEWHNSTRSTDCFVWETGIKTLPAKQLRSWYKLLCPYGIWQIYQLNPW